MSCETADIVTIMFNLGMANIKGLGVGGGVGWGSGQGINLTTVSYIIEYLSYLTHVSTLWTTNYTLLSMHRPDYCNSSLFS